MITEEFEQWLRDELPKLVTETIEISRLDNLLLDKLFGDISEIKLSTSSGRTKTAILPR